MLCFCLRPRNVTLMVFKSHRLASTWSPCHMPMISDLYLSNQPLSVRRELQTQSKSLVLTILFIQRQKNRWTLWKRSSANFLSKATMILWYLKTLVCCRSTLIRRVTDRFILQIGLQKHYATLQAIALDEELEEIEDKTVPKFEMIDKVSFPTLKSHR